LKKIIFASLNRGKVREIGEMLKAMGINLVCLDDYPDLPVVSEGGSSFLENALIKARSIAKITGEPVLADDSGLEVAALGGAPGIYSARYAGEGANDAKNIRKLLDELRGVSVAERKAAFRCVLVLCQPDGSYRSFEGRWEGKIAEEPVGHGGFGYDPIFFLPDRGVTAAELPAEVKNRISHRAKAFGELRAWLQNQS
jgi:XTP/dITP diphosphohydrolase